MELPNFCKVGTGYNKNINSRAPGFIAVSDSVHLLEKMPFEAVFVDEAHHPLPPGMPDSKELFQFSATCPNTADNMGQAIEEGVLCDYDLTVPVAAGGHAYASLAALLVSHRGRFRRVLAYCNDVAEAKRVQRTFLAAGIAAWHINAGTRRKRRQEVIQEFSGRMRKPVRPCAGHSASFGGRCKHTECRHMHVCGAPRQLYQHCSGGWSCITTAYRQANCPTSSSRR